MAGLQFDERRKFPRKICVSQHRQLLPLYELETQILLLKRVRVTCYLTIPLFLLFSVLDFIVFPDLVMKFLNLRLGLVLFHGLCLGATFFSPFKKFPTVLGFVVYLTIAWVIIRMCLLSEGHLSPYYAGINLVVVGYSLLMPWEVWKAALLSSLIYLSYIGGILYFDRITNKQIFINNNFFILCTMLEAVAAAYLWTIYRESQFIDREKLKALDQAKTRFFANLTHEFRTPLVANSTLLQAIEEQVPLTSSLKTLLSNAKISLGQILENVNDLLTQTSSEKGFLEISWSRIEVVEFAKNNLELFHMLAKKRGVELVFTNDLKIPALEIFADRSKLKKILNNLLGNAIKFTHAGRIQLGLSADKGFLNIEVQDSGIGIPSEDLSHIFEPFSQASNNVLRDVQGTGLGLSIAKDFITAHHGHIEVKSELGKGTRFKVSLPLGDQHIDKSKLDYTEVIVEAPSSSERIVAFHADEDPKLKSYGNQHPDAFNLAIIEDNSHVVQSLAYMLQGEYNLHFARDGETGLELIRRVKPDLILCDIMMPKMNGYALLAIIKNDPELKKIPVVFLTAKVDLESKIQGLSEGADEYLTKPFNMVEVRTRIKKLLSRKKLAAECV